MQVQLRHNPSFTVARCVLAAGEPLRVEGGAMLAHSAGIVLESKAQGGIMKGLSRSLLGGGSFFVTTYTAPAEGGWVDIAGMLPGDTVPITIQPDRPFFLSRGSWIANSYGVEIDTQWGGMANLFGGEGGFGFRAHGQGEALVSIYGAVDYIDLQPQEVITIDTGHVVAYDLNIQFRMRRAVEGKSIQSLKSGEGWVFDFAGPGRCCCSRATRRRSPTGWPRPYPARRPARVSAACPACSADSDERLREEPGPRATVRELALGSACGPLFFGGPA